MREMESPVTKQIRNIQQQVAYAPSINLSLPSVPRCLCVSVVNPNVPRSPGSPPLAKDGVSRCERAGIHHGDTEAPRGTERRGLQAWERGTRDAAAEVRHLRVRERGAVVGDRGGGEVMGELQEVVRDDPLPHGLEEVAHSGGAGEEVERGIELELGDPHVHLLPAGV